MCVASRGGFILKMNSVFMTRLMRAFRMTSVLLGACLFLFAGSILPGMKTGVFASPDETAVFLFANAWTPSMGFRIPVTIDGPSREIVQLHPRSMVRQGDWLVPVGFLGMPFLVTLVNHLGAHGGNYVTLFLTLSSAVPLFFILRKSTNAFTSWSAVLVYLSFPTVLLYVNRGFFPNLPVIALSLWAVWLLRSAADYAQASKKKELFFCSALGGACIGVALLIRPIEAMWVLPWAVWSFWPALRAMDSWKKRVIAVLPLGTILVLTAILGVWLSMKSYPYHGSIASQPISGYQLSDFIPQTETAAPALELTRDVKTLVPFAFHPRTLWNNIRSFLFNVQGIWIGASVLGALIAWLRWKKEALAPLLLAGWTAVTLFLMYGQTVYADNITGSATIGNSFLRYLLPLVPLVAIGCAIAADRLRNISKRGAVLAISLIVFLTGYGLAYALNGDAESILPTRKQLARYAQIRVMTEVSVPADAVIVSERSDKIFASSASWTVASPLPDESALTVLRDTEAPVYLFHRLIRTDADIPDAIAKVFIVVADPLVVLDNEALYPVYGLPTQSE